MTLQTKTISPVTAVIGSALGALLVVIGLAIAWSPIPFGVILLATGLTLLVWANPWVRQGVRALRTRSAKVNAALTSIQNQAPGPIRRTLERTDPMAASATPDAPAPRAAD